MSPAPRVRTTSPGPSASYTRRPTSARVGSNRASAPARCGRVGHLAAAHARDRLLARGVDLGHDHQIGGRQRLAHGLPMRRRAGVEVRLEHRHQPPPGKGLPRRRQRGGELRRVVRVVVHHRHPADARPAARTAGPHR